MQYKRRPRRVVTRLVCWAGVWLAMGFGLDRTGLIPFSKNLWSLSFCFGMRWVRPPLLLFLLLPG